MLTVALLIMPPSISAYCGDGKIQPGELCDGNNLGPIQGCTSFSYDGGILRCSDCNFDLSACYNDKPEPYCGDGIAQPGEQCEGSVTGFTCQHFGFEGGHLSCINCMIDDSTCINSPEGCGDGIIKYDEECDGNNWGIISGCENFGLQGTLRCEADCTFDMGGCIPDPRRCGNNIIDPAEECDGNPPTGTWGTVASCENFGYNYGELSCSEDCIFDKSECILVKCDEDKMVCGVDGRSYTNYCFAQIEGVAVAYGGDCINVDSCTMKTGFSCVNQASCYDTDTITLTLTNGFGVDIYPTSILVRTYARAPLSCVLASDLPYPWPKGESSDLMFECNNFGINQWVAGTIVITYRRADDTIWRAVSGEFRQLADSACGEIPCANTGEACGGVGNINCCNSEEVCVLDPSSDSGVCSIQDLTSCNDPDRGIGEELTQTIVYATDAEGTPHVAKDGCEDATSVREYMCADAIPELITDEQITSMVIPCDFKCTNGACIEWQCLDVGMACKVDVMPACCGEYVCVTEFGSPDGTCMIEEPAHCDDSDGGLAFDVVGTATAQLQDETTETSTDECIDPSTLTEWFCTSEGRISDITIDCLNGCASGACVEYSCSPEGGICGGIVPIECCGDFTCRVDSDEPDASGTCVREMPPPQCEDSDVGISYYTAGTVVVIYPDGSIGTQSDECSSGIELTEYYCDKDGAMQLTTFECAHGCSDNACVQVQTCGAAGESCSGVAGSICCKGLVCEYPEDDPYGTGICTVVKDCKGCIAEERCLPYGSRMVMDSTSMFCSLIGIWQEQVAVDDGCQNNYECSSNMCSSGTCLDLRGEFKETRGLLQRILDWLASIFNIGE